MVGEEKYRVAMVDDSLNMQQLIRTMLSATEDLVLTQVHDSAESAFRVMDEEHPNVFIVDLDLPDLSGLEFIKRAVERMPDTQFLVITSFDNNEMVHDALLSGANGYLLKSASPFALVKGIRELLAGGSPISPSVARRVVEQLRPAEPGQPRQLNMLSTRENEVLEFLAQGMKYREIADQLKLSCHTVKNHIRRIYSKLKVNTRVDAVNRYFER